MPNASPRVVSQPGGVSTTYTYDPAARVSSKRVVKGASGLSAWQQVTYDGEDNRTGELVSQAQPGGGSKMGTGTYAYDRLGRLVSATHPLDTASTKTYVLDDAGNIVSDGEFTYTYTNNRLARAMSVKADSVGAGVSFSYDGLGNLTGQHSPGGTVSFSYDGASQTKQQYRSTDSAFQDPFTGEQYSVRSSEDTVKFAYDALGRIVRRHESHWHREMDSGPAVTEELYFHDRNTQQRVLETTTSGSSKVCYVLDSTGVPIGQHQGGAFGWYVTDLRANLTQVLDGSGAVKSVYGYDPFGKEQTSLTNASSGFDAKLRYQLAPRDPRTGVYTLGPRVLDPGINRFVGADFYVGAAANMQLALDPLTGNRYLYAGANPAGYIDDGHSPDKAYAGSIHYWSRYYGISESLLAAVIHHEGSGVYRFGRLGQAYEYWGPGATVGIGQMNPRNIMKAFGLSYWQARAMLVFNPDFAVQASAWYLAGLQRHHVLSDREAFIAYAYSPAAIRHLKASGWWNPDDPNVRGRRDAYERYMERWSG